MKECLIVASSRNLESIVEYVDNLDEYAMKGAIENTDFFTHWKTIISILHTYHISTILYDKEAQPYITLISDMVDSIEFIKVSVPAIETEFKNIMYLFILLDDTAPLLREIAATTDFNHVKRLIAVGISEKEIQEDFDMKEIYSLAIQHDISGIIILDSNICVLPEYQTFHMMCRVADISINIYGDDLC